MWRYEVPVVDGAVITMCPGPILAAAAVSDAYSVEFWAEHDRALSPVLRQERHFVVVETGKPAPEGGTWVATCPRSRTGLVWHLYELAG